MHTVNYNTVAAAFNTNVLQCCTVMQAAKQLLLQSNSAVYSAQAVTALQTALQQNAKNDAQLYAAHNYSTKKALKLMQHKALKQAIAQYEEDEYDEASNTLIHAMLKRAAILNVAYC